ncbi:MAG: CHC2 zinc finger domain-containing protein [Archaeoglobaceae archaeon]
MKRLVSVEDVLSHFGVPVRWRRKPYYILCPFHDEKNPSFYVDVIDQVGYCFGCGKGGDVIRIAMEFLKTDFQGALTYLADAFSLKRATLKDPALKSRHRGPRDIALKGKIINELKFSARIDERARMPLLKRRGYSFDELERIFHHKAESSLLAFLRFALEAYFTGIAIMDEFKIEDYSSFVRLVGGKQENFKEQKR